MPKYSLPLFSQLPSMMTGLLSSEPPCWFRYSLGSVTGPANAMPGTGVAAPVERTLGGCQRHWVLGLALP